MQSELGQMRVSQLSDRRTTPRVTSTRLNSYKIDDGLDGAPLSMDFETVAKKE